MNTKHMIAGAGIGAVAAFILDPAAHDPGRKAQVRSQRRLGHLVRTWSHGARALVGASLLATGACLAAYARRELRPQRRLTSAH